MIRQWIPLACFTAVLLVCLACLTPPWEVGLEPGAATTHPPERAPDFQTPWQTESQYIVTTICSDLAGLMLLAREQRGPAADFQVEVILEDPSPEHPSYRVKAKLNAGPEVNCALKVESSLWDPALYLPWCQLLDKSLTHTPRATSPRQPQEAIQQLTNPQPQVLAQWDRTLSAEGQLQAGNPDWHDEAALLVGSLALREPLGQFHQIRHELCRMCAHLAMADFLRGPGHPGGTCHHIARATLVSLYGPESLALGLVDSLPGDRPGPAAWKRALRYHLTNDYRPPLPSPATLLEARERFRAQFVVGSYAGAWRDRSRRPDWDQLTDWTRLANTESVVHEDQPGMDLGQELLKRGLAGEAEEMRQVWLGEGWGALQPAQVGDFLNSIPALCVGGSATQPTVNVLGKGLWGAFLQRQLCHTLCADYDFLENRWGNAESARLYREQAEQKYSGLRLFPFVLRQLAHADQDYRRGQEESGKVIRSSPQVVPSGAWNRLFSPPDRFEKYLPQTIRVINQWHDLNPLPGTAYDLSPRMNHPSFFNRPDFLEKVRALQRESPHNPVIYAHLLRILGERKTPPSNQQLQQILGPMLDYNADAAFRMATESDLSEAESRQWLARAARINPRYLAQILDSSLEAGDNKQFESTFLSWLASAPDPVAVANRARPMVVIWEHRGERDKATALAEQAAQSDSQLGLCTQADLLESRGQLDRALALYEQSAERYGAVGPLAGALQRAAAKQPGYKPRLEACLQRLSGPLRAFQQPVDGHPPEQGVLVTSDVDSLKKDDVIVSVRGNQVTSQDQYIEIRDFQIFEPFSLVLFRQGRYLKAGPFPPHHRFGNLQDYQRT